MPVLGISFQNSVTGSLSKPRVFIKGGNQGASSRPRYPSPLLVIRALPSKLGPHLGMLCWISSCVRVTRKALSRGWTIVSSGHSMRDLFPQFTQDESL